ncbi:ribonuclease H1/H2 small subunit, putative [Trypanosoma brucei gambiense DAL972]|uniref:Ribonuclease H1/H2 small subunit, putative n=1 Tax=Trypanosoma brucei gambiense (strain MHOM/CI/86/DAL972) TaxID=679716 RepID=C9ZI43_TRYB9|nr:ribonuclease H1/H2 small subunit, putative [Trypanosoma brucei gambiense DAL972]CBH09160.1 ribonuclease H1/H2 small subunit, putative [Trypanosoma brucei gambiense DAL972]|eukprot:XP_011771601.1 ribonuclease H1/H2 small subunit, putative [Trypanosoma brucei gambiense DAL972]
MEGQNSVSLPDLVSEGQCNAPVVIHSLPVKTNFRGTTDVTVNFTQHTVRGEGGELRNALRGRTLIGREVILPSSYVIACASFTNKPPIAEAGGRKSGGAAACFDTTQPSSAQVEAAAGDMRITAVAERFCIWEHDKKPERSEMVTQWLRLSNDLHCYE